MLFCSVGEAVVSLRGSGLCFAVQRLMLCHAIGTHMLQEPDICQPPWLQVISEHCNLDVAKNPGTKSLTPDWESNMKPHEQPLFLCGERRGENIALWKVIKPEEKKRFATSH